MIRLGICALACRNHRKYPRRRAGMDASPALSPGSAVCMCITYSSTPPPRLVCIQTSCDDDDDAPPLPIRVRATALLEPNPTGLPTNKDVGIKRWGKAWDVRWPSLASSSRTCTVLSGAWGVFLFGFLALLFSLGVKRTSTKGSRHSPLPPSDALVHC